MIDEPVEDVTPAPEPDEAAPQDPLDVDGFCWLVAEYGHAIAPLEGLLEAAAELGAPNTTEEVLALAVEAEAEGRIQLWEYHGLPCATLDVEEAHRMGLRLSHLSERWVPEGTPPPQPHKNDTPAFGPAILLPMTEYEDGVPTGGYRPGDEHRSDRRSTARDASMWIDPAQPEPLDVLTRKEGELIRDGSMVPVYLILGIGLPWPEATEPAPVRVDVGGAVLVRSVCRGCLGRLRLPYNAYCAICDRSGIDHRLPAVEPSLRQGGRKGYAPGGLGGGTGTPPGPREAGEHGGPLRPKVKDRQRTA